MKPLVYLVEDDVYLAPAISTDLEDLDCKVKVLANGASLISQRGRSPDLVISDLYIPAGARRSRNKVMLRAGNGIEALRRARAKWPKSRFVLITGMPSSDAQKWCRENDVTYQIKPVTRETWERHLGLRKLRAFVVHGRNASNRKKASAALKKARIEPVVLLMQPSRGQTVIEKFEAVADTCDAAIVVWSPDDFGGLASSEAKHKSQSRARQNVVFELGYFYGALRRLSGRVVFLEFGDTELPSDLAGIIRIDALRPIGDIATDLKKEFQHLLE